MNKISLVQLSQLENKPKKLKFKNTEFTLQTSSCYVDKFKVGLDNYIYFEEFNEPLIEIVPDSVLSDAEKTFLKFLIKYCYIADIDSIQKIEFSDFNLLNLSSPTECVRYRVDKKYFVKLEDHVIHDIKELGVDE